MASLVETLALIVRHGVRRRDGGATPRLLRLLVAHGRLRGSHNAWLGSGIPRPMLALLAAECYAAAWGWELGERWAREASAAVPVAVARRATLAFRRGNDPRAYEIIDDALGEMAPALPEGFALDEAMLAAACGARRNDLVAAIDAASSSAGDWCAGLTSTAESAAWEAYSDFLPAGVARRASAAGAR